MKVEDPSALLVQWFHHKSTYLPKGDESSWQNCIKFAARSATTKQVFIATEKTFMDTRNTGVRGVGFNGHQREAERLDGPERRNIPLAPFAARLPSCTTIWSITVTTAAVTRSATIRCSYRSPVLFQLRPCPSSLERRISNGCATLSM